MALFEYQAVTVTGRAMSGTVEAVSNDEAAAILRSMNLTPSAITLSPKPLLKSRMGRTEFLLFNQQLASITKAGIPLERGLRELAADAATPSMRKLLNEVASELEGGASIEDVFAKREHSVPQLYREILKAGVKTGRLSEMLAILNRHLEIANQTRRIVFEALTYPIVVLLLAGGILTFMFTVMVPQFEGIYAGLGARVPAITSMLFTISRNIVPFWTIVGVAVLTLVLFSLILRTPPAGRRFKERLKMRVPLLGRIYHLSLLSQLSDGMATLVAAGCDMPSCLRMGGGTTGSEIIRTSCDLVASQVEGGANLLSITGSGYIPRLFLYSIELGGQRNELEDSLHNLGEMYKNQAMLSQGRLKAVLLPLMLVLVGFIVGSGIIALFMPMIQVLDSIRAYG